MPFKQRGTSEIKVGFRTTNLVVVVVIADVLGFGGSDCGFRASPPRRGVGKHDQAHGPKSLASAWEA